MMADNGRRSSRDPLWLKCKEVVDKRDKRQCQFERCLSAKEAYSLQKGSPVTLDRAHILPASSYPDFIYNPKNVVTLRRFIHQRLDNYQSPLNGDSLDRNEHAWWWWRLLNKLIIDYDTETDYELLLLSAIK